MLGVGQCISHVSGGNLEEKKFKIFEKVGFPIKGNNIEACYWISKKMKR